MLVATIGERLAPLKTVLHQVRPSRILFFHLPQMSQMMKIESEVVEMIPDVVVEWLELDYPINDPNLDTEDATRRTLTHIWREVAIRIEGKAGAYACVTGGTKWMGHALHHIAMQLSIPVIVTPNPEHEGDRPPQRLFPIREAIQRAEDVRKMKSSSWVNCLIFLAKNQSATREEIADHLRISEAAVAHIINGRTGHPGLTGSGLTGGEYPLVEQMTSVPRNVGRPAIRHRLTLEGQDVERILQS